MLSYTKFCDSLATTLSPLLTYPVMPTADFVPVKIKDHNVKKQLKIFEAEVADKVAETIIVVEDFFELLHTTKLPFKKAKHKLAVVKTKISLVYDFINASEFSDISSVASVSFHTLDIRLARIEALFDNIYLVKE